MERIFRYQAKASERMASRTVGVGEAIWIEVDMYVMSGWKPLGILFARAKECRVNIWW